MRKYKIRHFTNIIFLLAIILLIASCTPQKKLIYLQDTGSVTVDSAFKPQQFEYKLQAKDVLYINVKTLDLESNNIFSEDRTTQYAANSDLGLYINGYTINDSGNITLPVVGDVYLLGLNLEEAQQKVQQSVNKYLKEAVVTVKITNFKIVILGEVGAPGVYTVYNSKINILEALGMAGDLDIYGKREITLVRNENSKQTFHKLDLKDRKLLQSNYYYLLPNDIIIVDPLPAKSWGFANAMTPITLSLSLISTTLLIINFVK